MKTYYFDNSAWIFSDEKNVITEAAFRKLQDNFLPGWNHHWLSTEANSLIDARIKFEAWTNRA